MKCQKGKTCVKRPSNSAPLSKKAKMCTGCDKTGRDVKPNVKKEKNIKGEGCPKCKDNMFLFHKDPLHIMNGTPCPDCNPAALVKEKYSDLSHYEMKFVKDKVGTGGMITYVETLSSEISIKDQLPGVSCRTAKIVYRCGCEAILHNPPIKERKRIYRTDCPTRCIIHNETVKSYTETKWVE